jgi:hypothetical protein
MHQKAKPFLPVFLFFLSMISALTSTTPSQAQVNQEPSEQNCSVQNRECLLDEMITLAENIQKKPWRDQTYREIAKTLAFENNFDKAVSIIDKIENPDTKAMTIRGIGMMLATHNYTAKDLNAKFEVLHKKANEIEHAASHGIALTYIAMAQAFTGDDEGAWKTCAMMENESLRNKAYGETAEIQAERGDYTAAQKSIQSIESIAYSNKAYDIVSHILSDKELFGDALRAINAITNPYKKAQALQYMLDKQKPRERLQINTPNK